MVKRIPPRPHVMGFINSLNLIFAEQEFNLDNKSSGVDLVENISRAYHVFGALYADRFPFIEILFRSNKYIYNSVRTVKYHYDSKIIQKTCRIKRSSYLRGNPIAVRGHIYRINALRLNQKKKNTEKLAKHVSVYTSIK